MKKILIFLFSLALSAALLFSLCACTPATPDTGDGSGEDGGGSEERGDPILVIFQNGTAVKRNYYYPGTVTTPPELEDVQMGS